MSLVDASNEVLDVSVVVCAYTDRRWQALLSSLDSVLGQRPAAAEVLLVVDHNPSLAARAQAARPTVTVIESTGEPGLSGARNTGLRAARHGVTVFLDDDAEARVGWLDALVSPFHDSEVVGTSGYAEPRWPERRPSWLPPEFDWVVGCSYVGLPITGGTVRNPVGCTMSVRTAEALDAGGFDARIGHVGENGRGCEETDLAIRLTARRPGWVIRYVPEAIVDHNVDRERLTGSYFLRRCWNEGISKAIVVQMNGSKGLESERNYVAKALPAAIRRDFLSGCSGNLPALWRIVATLGGSFVAAVGYASGRFPLVVSRSLRRIGASASER
jgi:O-antigen biosynthesis protein